MLLQQEIIKILQESKTPLGPSAISEKLNKQKNLTHYHLKKMVDEGTVTSSENGKYSINKDKMEIIRELGDEILHLLSSKEYHPEELQQKVGHDENLIISAIGILELQGFIKEGQISLAERGGIPRKGLTIYDTNYCRASTYTPTYLGYSKIGFCPVCREKLDIYETVVVAFFKSFDLFRSHTSAVKIHSKCLTDSKSYEMTYGICEKSIFCYHCGLPLSPKMLPKRSITFELIIDYFLGIELESIRLLDELRQSWKVPLDIPILGEKFSLTPQNLTIEKVYNNLEIKIPNWVSERLKKDESDPEKVYYKDISWEISNDLQFKFEKDISQLNNAENFIRLLMKYRDDFPKEYDVNSRIKDVWAASQEIKKKYEIRIQENYEKLLGPQSSLYSCIDWVFDVENYDFDKVRSDQQYKWGDSPIFSQTLGIKCRDNYYHPYCAEKLGLTKDHCNDKNSKGGENVGEKIRNDR